MFETASNKKILFRRNCVFSIARLLASTAASGSDATAITQGRSKYLVAGFRFSALSCTRLGLTLMTLTILFATAASAAAAARVHQYMMMLTREKVFQIRGNRNFSPVTSHNERPAPSRGAYSKQSGLLPRAMRRIHASSTVADQPYAITFVSRVQCTWDVDCDGYCNRYVLNASKFLLRSSYAFIVNNLFFSFFCFHAWSSFIFDIFSAFAFFFFILPLSSF